MKRVISTCLTLCLSAALALPASALDYSIDALVIRITGILLLSR